MSTGRKPSWALRTWRRLMGREEGNATLEFAILFPLFLLMFLSMFEIGLLMTRYMMFDRALDVAVRQVRLSEDRNFTEAQVKQLLCDQTVILRDHCFDDLTLEMRRLDASTDWSHSQADATCSNVPLDLRPSSFEFSTGSSNDVIFIRACIAMNPVFPTSGLGELLVRNSSDDKLYMIASSAISVEPVD